MYRNAYQRGMLTIFFSGGAKPLEIWDTKTQDGYISRFLDQDIKSMVLEIGGTNVSTTFMICPKGKTVLGITMPFLVMIVKNLKKYFTFEVTILDETSTRRRFRVSNFQSTTQILPLCTVMPIGLSEGWNQIQFNLAEFTRRAYKKQFVEVQKLKINANIRLRRIYFTERLIPEDQLPPEYKLYFPLPSKGARVRKPAVEENKENLQPSTSQQKTTEEPVEEKPGSKLEVIKPGSKASVHTLQKTESQEAKKQSKIEVDTVLEEPAVETAASIEGLEETVAETHGTEGETVEIHISPEEVTEEHINSEGNPVPHEVAPNSEEVGDTPGEVPEEKDIEAVEAQSEQPAQPSAEIIEEAQEALPEEEEPLPAPVEATE